MHFDDLESWGDYWLQGLPLVSRDLLGIIIMCSWGPGRRGRQGRRGRRGRQGCRGRPGRHAGTLGTNGLMIFIMMCSAVSLRCRECC